MTQDPLHALLASMEASLLKAQPATSFAHAVQFLRLVERGRFRRTSGGTPDAGWWTGIAARYARLYMATVRHVRWDPLRDPSLTPLLFSLETHYSLVRLLPTGNLDEALAAQAADFERARSASGFLKILLLWAPRSQAIAKPFAHVDSARAVVVAQALASIAGMVCADETTNRVRNEAIDLLASGQVHAADLAPFLNNQPVFGSAWMRSSYATAAHRHDVKKVMNAAVRAVYAARTPPAGCETRHPAIPRDGRPRLVVPTEWAFREGGAMYRCYASVLLDLRRRFQVIGMGLRDGSDESTARLFDHFVAFEETASTGKIEVACVAAAIQSLSPAMVFYPSVGMLRLVVCLANMRLAPVQIMSVGHPATTHSDCIDYVVTERGFVGDPDLFSERLLLVPDGSMTFDAPAATGSAARHLGPPDDGRVHVAVPAVAHKLSWLFIRTLKQVLRESPRPVVFHFFSGMQELHYHELRQVLAGELPGCVVYPWMEYQEYLDKVDRCHIHAASFPFGGTNSLIDSLRQGIPVVAMRGREVHECIDAEFLRRLGLEDVLVADTPEAYAAILVRLAADPAALAELRRRVREEVDVASVLMHSGHPEHFTEAMWAVLPAEITA